MTNNLMDRLREAANLDLYGVHRDVELEAARHIEDLEKMLKHAQDEIDDLYEELRELDG